MNARELAERLTLGRLTVLDVRTPAEWQSGHIEGSVNLPVGHLVERLADVPRDQAVATICESGGRASLAASILSRAGLRSVMRVRGGMAEYRRLSSPRDRG